VLLGHERFNTEVEKGSAEFMGDIMSRVLGVNIPPIEQCTIEPKDQQIKIRNDQEPVPMLSQVIKEHWLVFHLGNVEIPPHRSFELGPSI
jgi:hypothetical protein